MNAMLEPRMVAAKIHGPFTAAGCEHRLLRIAASLQGGLAIVVIRPFSAGSLSVGSPGGDVAQEHWRTSRRQKFTDSGRLVQTMTPHPRRSGRAFWLTSRRREQRHVRLRVPHEREDERLCFHGLRTQVIASRTPEFLF